MAIIDNKSISFDNVITDILSYLGNNANADANKWLDTYSSGAGITIAELIAGLSTYLSYSAMSSRREAFLESAKLNTSVYSLANIRGVNIRRPEAPKIVIKFNEPTTFPRKIGTVKGIDLWVMSPYFDLYGEQVENTYNCYLGNYEEANVTVASPGNFYTLNVNPTQYEGSNKYFISNEISNISVIVRREGVDHTIKLSTATEDLMRGDKTDPDYAEAVVKTTIDGINIVFGYSADNLFETQSIDNLTNYFDVVYHGKDIIVAGSSTDDIGIVYSYDGITWYKSDVTTGKIDSIDGDAYGNFMAGSITSGYLYVSQDAKKWTIASGPVSVDGYDIYYSFPKVLFTSLPYHIEKILPEGGTSPVDTVVEGRKQFALACKQGTTMSETAGGIVYASLTDGEVVSNSEFLVSVRKDVNTPFSPYSLAMVAPMDIASNGNVAIAMSYGVGAVTPEDINSKFDLYFSSNGGIWTRLPKDSVVDSDSQIWGHNFKSKIIFVKDRFFLTRQGMGVWEFKPTLKSFQSWRVTASHGGASANSIYGWVGNTWEALGKKYNYVGSVATFADLPTTGLVENNAYLVGASYTDYKGIYYPPCTYFYWNGTAWERTYFDFVFNYKGKVNLVADLPVGALDDAYIVAEGGTTRPINSVFRYNGTAWVALDIQSTYAGSVDNYAELPIVTATVGNCYLVVNEFNGKENALYRLEVESGVRVWNYLYSGSVFTFKDTVATYEDLPSMYDPNRVYLDNEIDANDIVFTQSFGKSALSSSAFWNLSGHASISPSGYNSGRNINTISPYANLSRYGIGNIRDIKFDENSQIFVMVGDVGVFYKGVNDTEWTMATIDGVNSIGGDVTYTSMTRAPIEACGEEANVYGFVFQPNGVLGSGTITINARTQSSTEQPVYFKLKELSFNNLAGGTTDDDEVFPVIAIMEKADAGYFSSSRYDPTKPDVYPKRIIGVGRPLDPNIPMKLNSAGEKKWTFDTDETHLDEIVLKSNESILLYFTKTPDSPIFFMSTNAVFADYTIVPARVSLCGISRSGSTYGDLGDIGGLGFTGCITSFAFFSRTTIPNALPQIKITGTVVYDASLDFGGVSVLLNGGNVLQVGEFDERKRILAYGKNVTGVYCNNNLLNPENSFSFMSYVYNTNYMDIFMPSMDTMTFISNNNISYSDANVENINCLLKSVGDTEVIGYPLEDLDELTVGFFASQGRTGIDKVTVGDIILDEGIGLTIQGENTTTLEFIDGGVEESLSKIKAYVPGYNASYRRIVSVNDHIVHTLAARTDIWSANCYRCLTECCTSIIPYLRGYQDENGFIIQTYKSFDDNVIFSRNMLTILNRYRMVGETFSFTPAISTKFVPNIVITVMQGADQDIILESVKDMIIGKMYKIGQYFSIGEITDYIAHLDHVIGVHIRKPNDDYQCMDNEYLYSDYATIAGGITFKSSLEILSYDEDSTLGYINPPVRMPASDYTLSISAGSYSESGDLVGVNDLEVKYGNEYALSDLGVNIVYLPTETNYSGELEYEIYPNSPAPLGVIPGINMKAKFIRLTVDGKQRTYLRFYTTVGQVEIGSYYYSLSFNAIRSDETIINSIEQQLRFRVI